MTETEPTERILAGYPSTTAVAVLDPRDALILDERADQSCLPGSTVKLMTAIVALTVLDDLDQELTVVAEDLRRGSGNNLRAGDTLSFWDALHNLLLPSSNTTAGMLVRIVGAMLSQRRPITAFIAAMNYERFRLGLHDTRFTNATGLYRPGMPITSTAHDIARLVRAASRNPVISELWSKKTYELTIGGPQARTVPIVSTIPELGPRVIGAKTGSTPIENLFGVACLLDTGHIASVVGTTKDDRWDILARTLDRLPSHQGSDLPSITSTEAPE